jgi:hypothetical protein
MQYFSDCDGSAIFRISSNNVAIWTNSFHNPMHFDVFWTSSTFSLSWVGGPLLTVLGVLSKITNTTNAITTTTTAITTITTTTTTTTIFYYTILYYAHFIVGAGCQTFLTHPLHARR